MRKLMLAGAAMLGTTSGIASAQAPAGAAVMTAPSQGMMAQPWAAGPAANNTNNAYGQPGTYQGSAAFGKSTVPPPGTVVIRLNGRVEVDMLASWSPNAQVLGAKTNPVSFGANMRLYPGVDGMANNGLRYGASVEIRQNFPGSAAQPTPLLTVGNSGTAAAVTPAFVTAAAPGPSAYSSGQTLFVRRVSHIWRVTT